MDDETAGPSGRNIGRTITIGKWTISAANSVTQCWRWFCWREAGLMSAASKWCSRLKIWTQLDQSTRGSLTNSSFRGLVCGYYCAFIYCWHFCRPLSPSKQTRIYNILHTLLWHCGLFHGKWEINCCQPTGPRHSLIGPLSPLVQWNFLCIIFVPLLSKKMSDWWECLPW